MWTDHQMLLWYEQYCDTGNLDNVENAKDIIRHLLERGWLKSTGKGRLTQNTAVYHRLWRLRNPGYYNKYRKKS